MFTQVFYLMTVRIKAPDHPAFAMKTAFYIRAMSA